MDVKQLEYFRAIVDAGTISGAARVLHMTQPPLSYQVKMLEEELQVQLFLRGTKKITLTEAGKTLYERQGQSSYHGGYYPSGKIIKASQAGNNPHRIYAVHGFYDVRLPDPFFNVASGYSL